VRVYVTVGNLQIQNLVLLELVAPVRLLVTMGHNASIGIDRVVEFQGAWLSFELLMHKILFFLIPFLFGYSRI
jgi:hypothetical protein